jgi:hypothetical protein
MQDSCTSAASGCQSASLIPFVLRLRLPQPRAHLPFCTPACCLISTPPIFSTSLADSDCVPTACNSNKPLYARCGDAIRDTFTCQVCAAGPAHVRNHTFSTPFTHTLSTDQCCQMPKCNACDGCGDCFQGPCARLALLSVLTFAASQHIHPHLSNLKKTPSRLQMRFLRSRRCCDTRGGMLSWR